MGSTIRWGILGAGNIAGQFAKGLAALDDAELVAVGSRSKEKADTFADAHGAANRHGSYEALAADPEVDAIYVATPHNYHKEHTLLCLEAGKAVLCEKPFALNETQGKAMADRAREKKLFLMEAMWTRFLPAIVQVREWLKAGAIGKPLMVDASFAFRGGWNPEGRHLNPKLAGGGLLDVGVYTIALASMVYGEMPDRITGVAHIGETGVDEYAALSLGYAGGGLASLRCGVRCGSGDNAVIYGEEGRIDIPHFWHTTTATLAVNGKDPETFEQAHLANGYEYEAMEAGRCMRDGKPESKVIPLEETLRIARTMDELRKQWSLRYPDEQ